MLGDGVTFVRSIDRGASGVTDPMIFRAWHFRLFIQVDPSIVFLLEQTAPRLFVELAVGVDQQVLACRRGRVPATAPDLEGSPHHGGPLCRRPDVVVLERTEPGEPPERAVGDVPYRVVRIGQELCEIHRHPARSGSVARRGPTQAPGHQSALSRIAARDPQDGRRNRSLVAVEGR